MSTLGRITLNKLYEGDYLREYEVLELTGLAGTVTFAGAATATVTFTFPQPDTSYYIALGGGANETFWWSAKATTGFTMNSSNAASTASVNYMVMR